MNRGQNRGQNNQRMRIRAFPAAVDDRFVTNTWDILERALLEILHKNNSGLSFEELYRNAYTMVLHKKGENLYTGLQNVVSNHLREIVRATVEQSINGSFLDTLSKAWSDHTTAMVMIRDILMYMDRVYVTQTGADPVYVLGLKLFRAEVINHAAINECLRDTLLTMIQLERGGEAIEWIDLKNACQMLLTLGGDSRTYYEEQFEGPFLLETEHFYQRVSTEFLQSNSASMYIRQVNQCIRSEDQRVERYLDKQTGQKLNEVLQKELIVQHMDTVLEMPNSGMVFMLQNQRIAELRELYDLFKLVPDGVKKMTTHMSLYLRDRGRALVEVQEEVNPVKFVDNLLELKELFDKFLTQSFADDREFRQKIQNDFTFFVNLNVRSPEYLALYIDDKLRKGLKSMNEGDTEQILDKVMVLFRFLQEKDTFERYYKQQLAKRLLFQKSISDDAEKLMISKLRIECGNQFTNKLDGMFKDMTLSETTLEGYAEHLNQAGIRSGIELGMNILTKVHWPTVAASQCRLPAPVSQAYTQFEAYYREKHHGRVLTLNAALGTADIRAIFYGAQAMDQSSQLETEQPGPSNAGRSRGEQKILQVPTYHMIVLLQFNDKATWTFNELLEQTKIPERDLKRSLQSLAMGKPAQRILVRKSNLREIDSSDQFIVNDAFTSKLTRIKIQMVSGKAETEPERKETLKKVEDDRKHEIEAAIVRVMKSRKTLIHNDLIAEVTNQLKSRFLPDPQVTKKRIESLIEREFLQRDREDHKKYIYLA